MRVLYFGTYEREYPRNAQVISCLRRVGVEVEERHVSVWDDERHKLSFGLGDLARAAAAEVRLALSTSRGADVVVVGYPGHIDMPAAKLSARGRPIVFNPLVSLEDTLIADRGLGSPGSLKARALRALDRAAFRRADLVVADTAAHGAYFRDRFGLADERVAVCYVGAEDRLFRPDGGRRESTRALFVGKAIPLHGLDTILAAAALCPELTFHVVGSGQLGALLEHRPPNVHWEPWVEYERLPGLYRSAGCALGIFGTSAKAARVIPNKAFQALATGTALVTADTPAARELLADGRDALLVPAGDPEALGAAVRRLATSPELARDLGAHGRATYETSSSEDALGARWRTLLESLLRS